MTGHPMKGHLPPALPVNTGRRSLLSSHSSRGEGAGCGEEVGFRGATPGEPEFRGVKREGAGAMPGGCGLRAARRVKKCEGLINTPLQRGGSAPGPCGNRFSGCWGGVPSVDGETAKAVPGIPAAAHTSLKRGVNEIAPTGPFTHCSSEPTAPLATCRWFPLSSSGGEGRGEEAVLCVGIHARHAETAKAVPGSSATACTSLKRGVDEIAGPPFTSVHGQTPRPMQRSI